MWYNIHEFARTRINKGAIAVKKRWIEAINMVVVVLLGAIMGLNLSAFLGAFEATSSQLVTLMGLLILITTFFKGELMRNITMFLSALLVGGGCGVTFNVTNSTLLIVSTIAIALVVVVLFFKAFMKEKSKNKRLAESEK